MAKTKEAAKPETPSSPWRRAWPSLVSAAAFAASVPFAKLWLSDVPRLVASGTVYLASGVGMSLFLLAFPRRGEERLGRRDLPWLALATGAGAVAAPVAYLQGLAATPASLTSLLLNLEVVLTAALAVAFFRERLDARRAAGTALVVLGSGATAFLAERGDGGAGSLAGPAWVALACLLWALDNNLTRRIAARDPVRIARWKAVVGGLASFGLALLWGQRFPAEAGPWLGGAAIGLLAYGLSLALFVVGLRRLGAARATTLFGIHPFLGVLASAAVLGEPLTLPLAGIAVVLMAGVLLVAVERAPRPGAVPVPREGAGPLP